MIHKLKVGNNEQLELYDFPGEYAQRFDGVDRGGGDRSGDLQKIFDDNSRTAKIRIQAEAMGGLVVSGSGLCRNFVSGHKFTLERHYDGDGVYVLTSVQHWITLAGDYRSGQGGEFEYSNAFTCIPFALPYRPARSTPKPVVPGPQTAVVVGPPGEEIFPDKYGRVKVQFHWDREGKADAESSCWIRVAQSQAGKGWGSIFIPRIGQEVLVAFEEGDPDQPVIVGLALQRPGDAALSSAGREDQDRPVQVEHQQRTAAATTRSGSRTARAPSRSTSTVRRISTSGSRTRCASRSGAISTSPSMAARTRRSA